MAGTGHRSSTKIQLAPFYREVIGARFGNTQGLRSRTTAQTMKTRILHLTFGSFVPAINRAWCVSLALLALGMTAAPARADDNDDDDGRAAAVLSQDRNRDRDDDDNEDCDDKRAPTYSSPIAITR